MSELPSTEIDNPKFEKRFSASKLWQKVKSSAYIAGRHTTETALLLYYTSTAPATPAWCKTVIYGALGYFISLLDGIPDLTPVLGYTDDLAVMLAAIATLTQHITPEIRQQAKAKAEALFGSVEDEQ